MIKILHRTQNSIQTLIHDFSSILTKYRITENVLQKGHSPVQLCKVCKTIVIQWWFQKQRKRSPLWSFYFLLYSKNIHWQISELLEMKVHSFTELYRQQYKADQKQILGYRIVKEGLFLLLKKQNPKPANCDLYVMQPDTKKQHSHYHAVITFKNEMLINGNI